MFFDTQTTFKQCPLYKEQQAEMDRKTETVSLCICGEKWNWNISLFGWLHNPNLWNSWCVRNYIRRYEFLWSVTTRSWLVPAVKYTLRGCASYTVYTRLQSHISTCWMVWLYEHVWLLTFLNTFIHLCVFVGAMPGVDEPTLEMRFSCSRHCTGDV